ncbi:MAG: hypothetical protein MUF00_10655 [Gemmatimonadaceae bacterium]|nr:hypothetical protein [Gemmatimonadaceae bacterium]
MTSDIAHDEHDHHAFRMMNRVFGVIGLVTLLFGSYAISTRFGHPEPNPTTFTTKPVG